MDAEDEKLDEVFNASYETITDELFEYIEEIGEAPEMEVHDYTAEEYSKYILALNKRVDKLFERMMDRHGWVKKT